MQNDLGHPSGCPSSFRAGTRTSPVRCPSTIRTRVSAHRECSCAAGWDYDAEAGIGGEPGNSVCRAIAAVCARFRRACAASATRIPSARCGDDPCDIASERDDAQDSRVKIHSLALAAARPVRMSGCNAASHTVERSSCNMQRMHNSNVHSRSIAVCTVSPRTCHTRRGLELHCVLDCPCAELVQRNEILQSACTPHAGASAQSCTVVHGGARKS